MSTVQWFFPDTLEEALAYLGREGVAPHGGGTNLVKSGISSLKGVVDLSRLELDFMKIDKGVLEAGATLTFSGVADNLANLYPDCLLGKALGTSASTPLRNRITLGGSAALFPLWSDLIGPMSVLQGSVCVAGENEGKYAFDTWLANGALLQGSLITSLLFPDPVDWLSYFYREIRVGFDYPAFTVSILARKNGDRVDEVRIAVSGGLDRVRRLSELEEKLSGADLSELDRLDVRRMATVEFGKKPSGSPQYLSDMAALQVERGLKRILAEEVKSR
ncbi:MAG: hypothetical protein GX181_06640 [Synergistaceae bacterium]|nr:FAD binding domain-containing protein [Synergistota bacterium]NLM71617.1 hypothetical protein [Synergistaceae bacterium]